MKSTKVGNFAKSFLSILIVFQLMISSVFFTQISYATAIDVRNYPDNLNKALFDDVKTFSSLETDGNAKVFNNVFMNTTDNYTLTVYSASNINNSALRIQANDEPSTDFNFNGSMGKATLKLRSGNNSIRVSYSNGSTPAPNISKIDIVCQKPIPGKLAADVYFYDTSKNSTSYINYSSDNSVDGKVHTSYISNSPSGKIIFDLGSSKILNRIRFFPCYDYPIISLDGAKLQGSNTSSGPFTDIYTFNGTTLPQDWKDILLNISQSYRYIQFISSSSNVCGLSEIEFYAAPQAPTNLTNTFQYKTVKLQWNSSDSPSHNIYKDGVFLANTDTNSFSDSEVVFGSQYTYMVKAADFYGNESEGTSITVTTPSIQSVNPPSGLTVTNTTSDSVSLGWTNSTTTGQTVRYRIYRNNVIVGAVSNNQFKDTGLFEDTPYTYKVTAFNEFGSESVDSNTVSTTTLEDEYKLDVLKLRNAGIITLPQPSNIHANMPFDYCFDGNTGTICSTDGSTNQIQFTVTFNQPVTLSKIRTVFGDTSGIAEQVTTSVYNGDSDLQLNNNILINTPNATSFPEYGTYNLNTTTARKVWSFIFTRTDGNNYIHISEIEIYARSHNKINVVSDLSNSIATGSIENQNGKNTNVSSVAELFDDDPNTLAASTKTDIVGKPLVTNGRYNSSIRINLSYQTAITIDKIRLKMAAGAGTILVEATDVEDNFRAVDNYDPTTKQDDTNYPKIIRLHQSTYAPIGEFNTFKLSQGNTYKYWRFTITRFDCQNSEVGVSDIELLKGYDLLNISNPQIIGFGYDSTNGIPYGNSTLGSNAIDGNVSNYYITYINNQANYITNNRGQKCYLMQYIFDIDNVSSYFNALDIYLGDVANYGTITAYVEAWDNNTWSLASGKNQVNLTEGIVPYRLIIPINNMGKTRFRLSFERLSENLDGRDRYFHLREVKLGCLMDTPDLTPPSVPTGFALNTSGISGISTSFSWNSSTDSDSGIGYYNIYRNGTYVGTNKEPIFNDYNLAPDTTYNYTVRAVDNIGNESLESAQFSITTADKAVLKNVYNVILLNYRPDSIDDPNNNDLYGFTPTNTILQSIVDNFNKHTNGSVVFNIIERHDINGFPPNVKKEYEVSDYTSLQNRKYSKETKGHALIDPLWKGGKIDLDKISMDYEINNKIETGEADIVFLATPTWCGQGEWYWDRTKTKNSKSYFVDYINYERDAATNFENFTHMAEQLLYWSIHSMGVNIWQHSSLMQNGNTLTNVSLDDYMQMTLTEKANYGGYYYGVGKSNLGDTHWMPNTIEEYVCNNTELVKSNASDWYNYPSFKGIYDYVNNATWFDPYYTTTTNAASGDHRLWWTDHIPRNPGTHIKTNTSNTEFKILNNWWPYVFDQNRFNTSPINSNVEGFVSYTKPNSLITMNGNWSKVTQNTSGTSSITYLTSNTNATSSQCPNEIKAYYDNKKYSDQTITGSISIDGSGDSGIIFRARNISTGTDSYDGYYFGISSSINKFFIGKCQNGVWSELSSSSSIPIQSNNEYQFKIDTTGAHIDIELKNSTGGIATLSLDDNTYTNGFTGYRTYANDSNQTAKYWNMNIIEK